MDFEFETTLRTGATVTVIGYAEVDHNCVCCDKIHVEAVDYESVTDLDSGIDLRLTDRLIRELDPKTDAYLYGEFDV